MGYAGHNYARQIGRLGALAIALGVGYGVAGVPAYADTTDSPGAESSSSSASTAHKAGKSRVAPGAARRGPARGTAESDAPAARASAGKPSRSAANDTAANDSSPAPSGNEGGHGSPRPSAAVADPPAAPAADTPVARVTDSRPARTMDRPAEQSPSAQAPAASVATVASAPRPSATTQSTAPAPAPAAARPLTAGKTAQMVSGLAPLLGGGTGGAPGQSPLLFGVLAWARREFERITGVTPPAAGTTTSQSQSPNLLVNPGAESSTPSGSGYSAVSMPGWAITGTPTVIKYGTPRIIWSVGTSFPMPTLPSIWSFPKAKNGPADGGAQFFGGGNVADAALAQTVDLAAAAGKIDAGNVSYNLGAWLGGYSFDPSAASVKVTFLDANNKTLGSDRIGPVGALQRLFAINLLERSTTGTLPVGTRSAQVEVVFTDKSPIKYGISAGYNNAFADNISFTIGADLPAAPDPTPSTAKPPALDHVYLVYLENKGYNNIVGSKNAPYLNGLINTYGFAQNFYGLTHGSLPNYYPIIGGDNFGITYNCATACIDVPLTDTLPGQIDLAGKTWKSYAQSLTPGGNPLVSSGDYAFDETGFPAFKAIGADPDYAKAHIVPLEQMAVDLQSKDTAPNFAWFAANENFNGEGASGLSGMIKFALDQLEPLHQYDVPALDQFLSETVPTILDSPVWKDPTQKSVLVVTFDEDNNNLSLGFGNEGNHIVTVVIPSEGAIAAGMKGGAFNATNYYSLYSILHFVEGALGLPPLTNNDKYAPPMTEFWNGPGNGGGSVVV